MRRCIQQDRANWRPCSELASRAVVVSKFQGVQAGAGSKRQPFMDSPWDSATLRLADRRKRVRRQPVELDNPWAGVLEPEGPVVEPDNPWADVEGPKRTRPRTRQEVTLGVGSELALVAGPPGQARLSAQTVYQQRGADPDRVRARWTTGACKCAKVTTGCHRGIPIKALLGVCTVYWSMADDERAHLVRTCYMSALGVDVAGGSGSVEGEEMRDDEQTKNSVKWNLCGVRVCYSNFLHLLGTSSRAIAKCIKGMPDMRRTMCDTPARPRPAPRAQHVDFFFYELYQSAAEPLPDGSTARSSEVTLNGSPWCDDNNPEEMIEWTPDAPSVERFVQLTVACQGAAVPGVPVRFLPHARLHDLYWMFVSQWDLLRAQGVQGPDVSVPSYTLFWRRWQIWKVFLRFRKASQHAQCQTCFELQTQMHKTSLSWDARLSAARALRLHYRLQYEDRCVYWALRFASQQPDSQILCLTIDTMDKAKFAWPRWPFGRVSKNLDGLIRPRTVLTAAVVHGWCTVLYVADEIQNHGSDAFCEILCRAIQRVWEMSVKESRSFPRHLVIQSDNTVSQAKHGHTMLFLAYPGTLFG